MTEGGGGELALNRSGPSRLVDPRKPALDMEVIRGGCGSGTLPGIEGFRWKMVLGSIGSPDHQLRKRAMISLGILAPEELGPVGFSPRVLGT